MGIKNKVRSSSGLSPRPTFRLFPNFTQPFQGESDSLSKRRFTMATTPPVSLTPFARQTIANFQSGRGL